MNELLLMTGADNMASVENHVIENSVPIGINHLFGNNQYVREMVVPEGALVVGKRHKNATLNILAKGSVIIYNEWGKEECFLEAPATFYSEPQTKKIGFFLEESVWINVFNTSLTDFDELEAELFSEEDVGKQGIQNFDGTIDEERLRNISG